MAPPLWGAEPVKVFDGTNGALQFGYFPPFMPDGDGGAVFVWYTVTTMGSVHVQHILADGSAGVRAERRRRIDRRHAEPFRTRWRLRCDDRRHLRASGAKPTR